MIVHVLFITVCVVGGGALLFFLRGLALSLWANRVINVDPLVFIQKRTIADKREYVIMKYKEAIGLVKYRVIRFFADHKDPDVQEFANLLRDARKYRMRREQTGKDLFSVGSIVVSRFVKSDILNVEIKGDPVMEINVGKAPEELLRDLDKLERIADILKIK